MPPSPPAKMPPRPLANSYWVEPGRLLAGEYPGSSVSDTEAAERIQRLLQAGVTSFVDLTMEEELPTYDDLLPRGLPRGPRDDIHYRRLPILDHNIPDSQDMVAILDVIDAELAAGRCVYVHCRAGIGRTATTVGCHLIRTGMAGDAALDLLQELWQQCARSRSWPTVPETQEQIDFVLRWREGAAAISAAERCEGALIGLAVGEAFGTLRLAGNQDASAVARSIQRDGVALETGAYVAMTQDVAESLLACQGFNAADQMQRYVQSTRGVFANAAWSADFKRALAAWQWSRKPAAGSHDPANLDAHSLPRSLAAAMYQRKSAGDAIDLAVAISRATQQSPAVLDACRLWTAALWDSLGGASGTAGSDWRLGAAMAMVRSRTLRKELDGMLEGRRPAGASDTHDVISVLYRALAAFNANKNFTSGMLMAAGASAAATVGALYGSLAGAHYGVDAIPESWRRALQQRQQLSALARRFVE